MGKADRYFNAPIQLLSGFLVNSNKSISDIMYYCCYERATVDDISIEEAAEYYGITLGNLLNVEKRGKVLYDSIDKTVVVGINRDKMFEFYKEDKTEFEKSCFLAFLSLKSILQKKPYCKIDNKFFLARMDGKCKSITDLTQLSEKVFNYANEYQTVKIKRALSDSWGLVTYSRYTRGFYVSFSLSLTDLIYEAEKRRQSVKNKQRKDFESSALKLALERLQKTSA